MVDALGQGDGQVKVLAGKIALQEAVQVSVPLLALALQALTVQAVHCSIPQVFYRRQPC